MRQRRFLPSISLLLAFEAVARNRSVSAAARDLNLTQSTVSRLLQALEAQLGQTLFVRERKRLIPTVAALTYQEDISQALDAIQRASMSLVVNPGGGTISLAVLPTFGTRWLAPRLPAFLSPRPGVSINLSTRISRFSLSAEAFDAVIFYGEDDWPDACHMKLADESWTACASPEFIERHPIREPADLHTVTLLQLETRPTAWETWFTQHGSSLRSGQSGMLVDQFAMMIPAAIAGLGVGLLPDYLAQVEIGEGRLLPLLDQGVPGTGSYWLAWPKGKQRSTAVNAFCEWISLETSNGLLQSDAKGTV